MNSPAAEICARLRVAYPDAHCALHHRNALELLVATILSAQCTDERVNRITPALFHRYPTAADYAAAVPAELEEAIRSGGFFRSKARNIIGMAQALVARYDGTVPGVMEELVTLPGVGRKTASVILSVHFGVPALPVDTHVIRLSNLLGLTTSRDPVQIERELEAQLPPADWGFISHALIQHGRQVCIARRPQCSRCCLRDACPAAAMQPESGKTTPIQ